MKTRILAMTLVGALLVAGSAPLVTAPQISGVHSTSTHAFGGPIERAIIQMIKNIRARRAAARQSRQYGGPIMGAMPIQDATLWS